MPELIFLADNHPISVWMDNQNPHPDVPRFDIGGTSVVLAASDALAKVADIAYMWGSTSIKEPKMTIYQDGTIKIYYEEGSYDNIYKKHYKILREGMVPFTDEQNYESSWTTDFAYFYNVNNINEHISLADLNTKYIKSPEVDFSKYPQNILRDYYGDNLNAA